MRLDTIRECTEIKSETDKQKERETLGNEREGLLLRQGVTS